jgi:hypothetical protein
VVGSAAEHRVGLEFDFATDNAFLFKLNLWPDYNREQQCVSEWETGLLEEETRNIDLPVAVAVTVVGYCLLIVGNPNLNREDWNLITSIPPSSFLPSFLPVSPPTKWSGGWMWIDGRVWAWARKMLEFCSSEPPYCLTAP